MKQAKSTFSLRPRHILMCCFVGLSILLVAVASQSNKLAEIKKQQEELNAAYEELQLEEQRLNRMLEYAQTDAYLRQYAREKLGYVEPDDYKFYRDAPTQ